jgi:hypothetical protein
MATYVMQVAESINIENICEAGSKAKILKEAGEHVPRVTLEMTFDAATTGFKITLT